MATISHASAEMCAAELLEVIPAVMRSIRTRMRKHSEALPSVVHFRALGYITREQNPDLSAVAAHLGLMLPSASKLVQALQVRGFVRRSADSADRRRILLRPTAKGKRVVETARRATRAQLAVLLRDCDPATRATIASAMQALRPIFRSEDPRLATSGARPDRGPRPKRIQTSAS